MDFYELIKSRQSIRNYDPKQKIDKQILKNILNAGILAPSACNNQPWAFILVSSNDILEKIRPCYHKPWFKDAPHILIIVGDKSKAWTRSYDQYSSIETDLTIAMDHIILAAENEGIAKRTAEQKQMYLSGSIL